MGKLVLVVDDSKTVRQVITASLKEAGHKVVEAIDGDRALKMLDRLNFDLIITDLHMPKINGIELVRIVRKNPALRFTPVIMVTDEGKDDMRDLGKQVGVSGWINKPFSPDQLTAIVNLVIGC